MTMATWNRVSINGAEYNVKLIVELDDDIVMATIGALADELVARNFGGALPDLAIIHPITMDIERWR